MQFRKREPMIQIIRTNEDPSSGKRSRQVVGRFQEGAPAVDEAIREKLTDMEQQEVSRYITGMTNKIELEQEYAAAFLPEMLMKAKEWVKTLSPEQKRAYASTVQRSLAQFRRELISDD